MRRVMSLFLLLLILPTVLIATSAEGWYSANFNGRGSSDSGRSEPQYVGERGYLAVSGSYYDDKDDGCLKQPWYISTYEKDKQFWKENGKVEHKTEVRVLWQELEHKGWGNYSGMLLVERLDNGKQIYVDVNNFITKPYWTYADLEDAVRIGVFLAEYHQSSDYYPVDKGNEKAQLKDGIIVLVVGPTGTYGCRGPDDETNQLKGIVYKKWKYGYGGVPIFFNKDDLSIIY